VIRIAALVAVACLIFGVGGVLGAGGHLWGATASALKSAGEAVPTACQKPDGVVDISFSKTKYPHIRAHYRRAVREGWPSVFVLNRKGASERRDKALEGVPTKPGYDRDEEPPAVGRKTWHTHVALVPSSENRSHGAALGIKLKRLCDGVKFRYVFY
jgi:hypothetical protein